ncbi:unnamed protein product [Rotaria magnacalcarata]|uniref:Uncharacterized protein n=1 Tax=Rotaria magnacalcarata TaxID=392030 RepID=A0A8S2RTF8_9BILA|nr:unnamed protein product [Rotaria magnacalcarata]
MQNFRSKLSDFQREQYRNHDAAARKRARAASKHQSNASFGSKQSLGKSVKKAKKNLPQDPAKTKASHSSNCSVDWAIRTISSQT